LLLQVQVVEFAAADEPNGQAAHVSAAAPAGVPEPADA
jgi:hypothetical protein